MIPILYGEKEKTYDNNGLGGLADAITCSVSEERNGAFELEMTYPITGALYSEIKTSAQIMATPGDGRNRQVFRIYKISKPLNGIITINAEHISYQLSYIPVAPFQAENVTQALHGLENNAAEECPFTFWTDKSTTAEFKVEEPVSIRSRLGGVQGSILDVYGGEYDFDMYTVRLYNQRGADRGVVLRYGKNITDLEQEENISNTITGIFPYWKDSEGNLVQLPEKIISAESAKNYPYPRTIPYDFSEEFEEAPTEEQLRTAAENYIKKSGIGVPSVSISVSFVALWQTEEYKEIAPLERVQLCDTVTVQFSELGVSATSKVNKTVWNVLKERYESIELGDAKSNLSTTIVAQEQEIEKKPSESFLQDAVNNATNWITNGRGYMVGIRDADGNLMEICSLDKKGIEEAMSVWRWNNGGFGHSKTGYNGPYTTAITQDGKIVADFILAGTLLANLIKAGVLSDKSGNFYLDMENGTLRMKNGEFTGKITSESGKIGKWNIEGNGLYGNYIDKSGNEYSVFLQPPTEQDGENTWVISMQKNQIGQMIVYANGKIDTLGGIILRGQMDILSSGKISVDGHDAYTGDIFLNDQSGKPISLHVVKGLISMVVG